jgi:hypothetical protein
MAEGQAVQRVQVGVGAEGQFAYELS